MWRVLGASARGVSHEKSETPCQDAMAWIDLDADVLICAVADGLGSAPRSEQGSKLAVKTAVDTTHAALQRSIPATAEEMKEILHTAFVRCADALRSVSGASAEPVESYDTTLLLSVVSPQWTATAHVGDGAIVVWRAPDGVETFSVPERNEFANIVTPITVPELERAIRYRIEAGAVSGVALITDGIQAMTINIESDSPHSGFFLPLFQDLMRMENGPTDRDREELRSFLASERVNRRTTDDKTILWAVHVPSSAASTQQPAAAATPR